MGNKQTTRYAVEVAPAPQDDVEQLEAGARWAYRNNASPKAAASRHHAGQRQARPDRAERERERHAAQRGHGFQYQGGTPSTATPPSASNGITALASPEAPSPDCISDAGSEASVHLGPVGKSTEAIVANQRLYQARVKSNQTMEALIMELRGLGAAANVRYASWPVGAAVEVAFPGDDPRASPERIPAKLVRYDSGQNSFEVRLRDGTTRIVPASRVRRSDIPVPSTPQWASGELMQHRSRPNPPSMLF